MVAAGLLRPSLCALVERAALLHDVGYGPAATHGIGFHPLDGAHLLQDLGEDQRLCHVVATHTGAHWEAHFRGIPPEAFDAHPAGLDQHVGLMRSIVTWADLHTSPTGEAVTTPERVSEILQRYPADDVVHQSVSAASSWLLLAGSAPDATADLDPADVAREALGY